MNENVKQPTQAELEECYARQLRRNEATKKKNHTYYLDKMAKDATYYAKNKAESRARAAKAQAA